jgi:hypothetical protein
MLIHITPRMYIPHQVALCDLVSLTIKEFGLSLTSKDLAVRKPYPNKRLWAACRRTGKIAITGLLLQTEQPVSKFTVESKWVIDGNAEPFTHVTNYHVLDDKYDCVSDNMLLWYGYEGVGKKWERRWAPAFERMSPAQAAPRMEIFPCGPGVPPREGHRRDILGEDGFIDKRTENFQMLTIEPERLFESVWCNRMPSRESVILVDSICSPQPATITTLNMEPA